MKRILPGRYAALACLCLLFFGCHKYDLESPCRMTVWQGLDDGYLRAIHYNPWGRADKWIEQQPSSGMDQNYTMSYDDKKRLSRMKFYDHGDLLYSIFFEYKNGRIAKENWFVGDTKTVDDVVENTYDFRGLLTKRESLLYKYYSVFTYDHLGNNTQADVIDTESGETFVRAIEDHRLPVREPNTTIEGVPYPVPFANQVFSPLIYTDYEFYLDSGNGLELIFDTDYEPGSIKSGKDRLAVSHRTFDKVAGEVNQQIFEYQNCHCESDNAKASNAGSAQKKAGSSHKPSISVLDIRKLANQRHSK